MPFRVCYVTISVRGIANRPGVVDKFDPVDMRCAHEAKAFADKPRKRSPQFLIVVEQ